MPAVTVQHAARALRVSASQVRRWIQSGAPVVRDRRPALVSVDELQRWRQGSDALAALELALLDTFRRDAGVDGRTAPQLLRIDDARAAALLLVVYDRFALALTGREAAPPYSASITTLREIAERARDARSG